ncbi:hypothetical protein ACJX0J_027119, partial [Zea mays]
GMRNAWEQVKEMRVRADLVDRDHGGGGGPPESCLPRAGPRDGAEGGSPRRHRRQTRHWAPNIGPQSHSGREVGGVRPRAGWPPTSAARSRDAPVGDAISLPELSNDELALFLAFLYTGALEEDGGGGAGLSVQPVPEERQLHALLVAADKYD